MNLEQMTVKVRPRKNLEAIDLGVALVQKNIIELYKIWLIITLPIYLLISSVFIESGIWVYLGFWLFKPIWERPLLHYLSRQLFGENLSIRDCIKEFFSLAKIQWFASLTWRRLSLTRSLDLPIIQLEGLKGAQRSERIKVIHSSGSGTAVLLTALLALLENVFYLGLVALAYLLLPTQMSESIDIIKWISMESDSYMVDFIFNLLVYCSLTIVAPFYTACGFALYLNQRTHLEAWDVELSFKRLAKKLENQSKQQSIRLASLMFIMSLFFMPGSINDLYAEENKAQEANVSKNQLSNKKSKMMIKEITQSDLFNQKETRYHYEFNQSFESKDEVEKNSPSSPIWHYLGVFISMIMEFILWVIAALLIIFLIVKYRHLIKGVKLPKKKKVKRPEQLFGLELNTKSLPDKPWLVALGYLEEGKLREATSLLYRASLIWYIENTQVVIVEGDTELECLRKIEGVIEDNSNNFMQKLTSSWRRLAYAHQIPDVKQLREYCEQWPEVFNLSAMNEEAANE
ncbi:hypothetical protein [Aliikangiella sp. IMCC44359]|uniref:hypothetical protein n=1 Tax=Aliikangiella sp. IMCC44359 TaxID=3459125 RepID=UPI00403B15A2